MQHSVKSGKNNHSNTADVTMQPVVRVDTEVIVWVDIVVMTEAKLDADGPTAASFTNTDSLTNRRGLWLWTWLQIV